MPAATAARLAALLRHALLLAAVLAVILGFLGMHVLANSHGTHASAAAAAEGSHATEHGTHPAGHHPAPPADARAHVDCTPSQAGAALSAPQPGATLVTARPHTAGRSGLLPRSTYLPGTPTPGDLSISRT